MSKGAVKVSSSRPAEPSTGYGFGTFKGVFTPSILTILGVIMYLRFGWVLGNVGLAGTLLIVAISVSITTATALSIAALATNTRVGAGGAYWIISRTLGLEAGAAIGIPLYFAKAIGISFYVAGFAESVVLIFPMLDVKILGVATITILSVLAMISADLAMRTQFLILVVIAVSLGSFFMGSELPPADPVEVLGNLQKAAFWSVFAVFFPAVTGIEAGLDMSGDLKAPSKSLPRGTLAALFVSLLIYIAIPIFLYRTVPSESMLINDSMVMTKVARWGPLVIAGIWGATLSSALGSILGAPRVLQALARDGILPRFLGKGYGHGDDPRIATAFSFLLGLAGILAGDLNVIAPILSMFFLTSYGILNTCSAFESLIASPSWRPTFRTPWVISALGALGCVAAMFMIDPGATMIAIVVTIGIYYGVSRREMRARWGDMRYGILMLIARYTVLALARRSVDARNWKPNVLAFTGHPESRWHLLEIADALARGGGLLTVGAVATPDKLASDSSVSDMTAEIDASVRKAGVDAIAKVVAARNYVDGARSLLDSYGFGPVAPNTVILGLSEKEDRKLGFAELLIHAHRARKNVIIVREGTRAESDAEPSIDIWWGGQTRNAGLMLALAYCLKRTAEWGLATLSIKLISQSAAAATRMAELEEFVGAARLDVVPKVIKSELTPAAPEFFELLREASAEATMVFVGLRQPGPLETPQDFADYLYRFAERLDFEAPTAFVMVAEEIEFTSIFAPPEIPPQEVPTDEDDDVDEDEEDEDAEESEADEDDIDHSSEEDEDDVAPSAKR